MTIEMFGSHRLTNLAEMKRRGRRLARLAKRMLSGNPTEGVYSMYVVTVEIESDR